MLLYCTLLSFFSMPYLAISLLLYDDRCNASRGYSFFSCFIAMYSTVSHYVSPRFHVGNLHHQCAHHPNSCQSHKKFCVQRQCAGVAARIMRRRSSTVTKRSILEPVCENCNCSVKDARQTPYEQQQKQNKERWATQTVVLCAIKQRSSFALARHTLFTRGKWVGEQADRHETSEAFRAPQLAFLVRTKIQIKINELSNGFKFDIHIYW